MASLLSSKDGLRVSDSFGGVFPNKVYATLEIRACSITLVQPYREDNLFVVSTVIGHFMLKPDPTTTNYIFILVGFGFCFLARMSREGTQRHG